MTVEKAANGIDLKRTVAWMLLLPFVVAWPILSTMSLLTLFVAGLTPIVYTVQFLLFITGFWTALGAYLFVKSIRRPSEELSDAPRPLLVERGVVVGGYILVWTVVYAIAAFASF